MSADSKDGFLAVCGTLSFLGIVSVSFRLVARRRQRAPIGWDDAFALTALLLYLGAVITELYLVHMRYIGYSSDALQEVQSTRTKKIHIEIALVWDILSNSASAVIKLSALFFYRRFFCILGLIRWFEVLNRATICIVVLWLITFVVFPLFQCGTHLNALWGGSSFKYCSYQTPLYLSLVTSNFALDLWILLLPIPNILRLNLPSSKKLSIIAIFILAFIGLGASIARIVIYAQIARGGLAYFETHDMGRNETKVAYLTMLEAGISLVAVNLPTLWTFRIRAPSTGPLCKSLSRSPLPRSRSKDVELSQNLYKSPEFVTVRSTYDAAASPAPTQTISEAQEGRDMGRGWAIRTDLQLGYI